MTDKEIADTALGLIAPNHLTYGDVRIMLDLIKRFAITGLLTEKQATKLKELNLKGQYNAH